MKWGVVVLVAVLAAGAWGCASTVAKSMGLKAEQARPISETRSAKHGVCAYADTSSFMGGTSSVKACARSSGDGESGAMILSEFTSTDDARWNPGNWRLELTAADGRVLLDSSFPMVEKRASALERASCFMATACITVGRNADALPEPWRAGTYRLRYTYLPDSKPVELTITLQ